MEQVLRLPAAMSFTARVWAVRCDPSQPRAPGQKEGCELAGKPLAQEMGLGVDLHRGCQEEARTKRPGACRPVLLIPG